jgi:hypothetical protein
VAGKADHQPLADLMTKMGLTVHFFASMISYQILTK